MKQAGSGQAPSEHPAQKLWSAAFVVVQIALSLVLLAGAALFLQHASPTCTGSRSASTTSGCWCSASTPRRTATAAIAWPALYEEMLKRLAAMPGAESASAARLRLFSGWVSNGSSACRASTPKASMNLNTNAVGPDFARTTGMRLIAGRDI